MPKLLQPLQQTNHNSVPTKKWKNWPDICQRVFNETYETMTENHSLFEHPKAKKIPNAQWNTTCWNAAWVAADACQKALKDIIKQKGYARETLK